MRNFLLTPLKVSVAAALFAVPAESMAYDIVAPGNLNAKVNGLVVDLSWDWGNADKCLLSESFEGDSFPGDKWEVRNTNSYDGFGNWMIYDFSDEDPEMMLCHDGIKAAVVLPAAGDDEDPASFHQDEWLIVRPGEGAAYLDFWYYLHPELLELGGIREFPDHYYVKISFDNGETWEELWDGRWDMGNLDGVQQASLFLGADADEDTLVAFQAVGGEQESIYFTWILDDIQFYSAAEKATRSSEEWLNNGNVTYRVCLDGESLFDYVKTRHYTDYSTKAPGRHVYKVVAWSEGMDEEYEAATVEVEIGDFRFPAARNVTAGYSEQGGKYSVYASWDAPEGDIQPAYYNVYVNGKSIGWIDPGNELSIGQSGLYKGVYTFDVVACYDHPEGESEKVSATVFPGTLPTPVNLAMEEADGGMRLRWEAPGVVDVPAPDHYMVYRGDVLLADDVKTFEYLDSEAPEGYYLYSVHAVYSDGGVSLPASVSHESDVVAAVPAPFTERFTNSHLPAGWKTELLDPYDRVKLMYDWRFDNWFEAEIPVESGLEDGFASVSGAAAGMNRLECYLCTPLVALPADEPSVLKFVKYFAEETPGPTGPAAFKLEVSEDGENFTDLMDLRQQEDGEISVALDEYVGKEVMFRWGFLGRNSGFAAVDNVVVDKASGVAAVGSAASVFDIFSVNGLVVRRNVSASALDALPAGIYLLRASDGSTRRFLKK